MKKGLLIVLALLLALPALSYAGSATSRWDLTIGGTVKTSIGWTDKQNTDLGTGGAPARDNYAGTNTIANKYGNWIWGGGETGINFGVRGPDAWGAKTSAFISADFVGLWGGSNYGTLDLVVATMTMSWPNDTLTIGMAGGGWGMNPTFAGMGFSNFGFGGKGPAPVNPQINLAHRFGKNFTLRVGFADQSDANSAINSIPSGAPTSYTRGDYPLLFSNLSYGSAACGKVGPWQLTFKVSGAWTQEKRTFQDTATTASDKKADVWYTDFVWMVPIIPEKNGNKTGALYTDGIIYTAQNFDGYFGGWGNQGTLSYTRPLGSTTNVSDVASPVSTGGLAHVGYYFTDKWSVNGFYWYAKNHTSRAFRTVNPNTLTSEYQYVLQTQYELNPAMKFQFMWDQTHAQYAGPSTTGTGLKQTGIANTYKFSAFYYF